MRDSGITGPGHNRQVRSGSQKAQGKREQPSFRITREMTQWYLPTSHLEELLPLWWAHMTPYPTMHQGNPTGHPEGCHSQHSSWTLNRSPKDCPPISWNWPTNLACPPPPGIPAKLLSEVEFSHQDVHRSPIQGSPDDDCNDNLAQSCTEEAVTTEEIWSHSSSA